MSRPEELNVHQRGVLRDVSRRIPDREHMTPAGHYPGPTLGALFRRGLIRRDPTGGPFWEVTDSGRAALSVIDAQSSVAATGDSGNG